MNPINCKERKDIARAIALTAKEALLVAQAAVYAAEAEVALAEAAAAEAEVALAEAEAAVEEEQTKKTRKNNRKVSLSCILSQDAEICHDAKKSAEQKDVWIGHLKGDTIEVRVGCVKLAFNSLSKFAMTHYAFVGSTRTSADGWRECYTRIEGKRVKMDCVAELYLVTKVNPSNKSG